MTAQHEEDQAAPPDHHTQVSLDATEDLPPVSFGKGNEPTQDVLINEEAENQKANRELRSQYADKAHHLAARCIQFWAALISVNALVYGVTGRLMVSDTAIIAITTGVTINVLAAFLGVIRGLFPADTPKKKES